MKPHTCCFTGHRVLPANQIEHIIVRLNEEIDRLIGQRVTNFISGGALGFDQIAAALIIAKKEMGAEIRLIFALPCRNQDQRWTAEQKQLYCDLLSEADEIHYISEEYSPGCMHKRNRHLVDNSDVCVCYLTKTRGGTAYTVNYAKQKGLRIINLV